MEKGTKLELTDKRLEANRENGKKGGRPKKPPKVLVGVDKELANKLREPGVPLTETIEQILRKHLKGD